MNREESTTGEVIATHDIVAQAIHVRTHRKTLIFLGHALLWLAIASMAGTAIDLALHHL